MITVWTLPDCKYCETTKRMLTNAEVEYTTKDLTAPENRRQLEAFKLRGFTSAPIVQTPTDTFSGWRADKLVTAINEYRTLTTTTDTSLNLGLSPEIN